MSVFVAFPAKAEVVQESAVQPNTSNSQSLIAEIPRLNEIAIPATTIEDSQIRELLLRISCVHCPHRFYRCRAHFLD